MNEIIPEAPSPETVKELVRILEQDGVDCGYGASQGGPPTKVLDGIQAMGKEWSARFGYGFRFPKKAALTIWERDKKRGFLTPRGYYDPISGERCDGNGQLINNEPQREYELRQNEIEELVAAF